MGAVCSCHVDRERERERVREREIEGQRETNDCTTSHTLPVGGLQLSGRERERERERERRTRRDGRLYYFPPSPGGRFAVVR
jgi:hypothetical protein